MMAAVIPRTDNGEESDMLSVAVASGTHSRESLVGDYAYISMNSNNDDPIYGTYNVTINDGIYHTGYIVSSNVQEDSDGHEEEGSFIFNGSTFTSTAQEDQWVANISQNGVFIIDMSEGNGGIVGSKIQENVDMDGEYLIITDDGGTGTVSISGPVASYVDGDSGDVQVFTITELFPGIFQGDVIGGPRVTFTILPSKAFFGNYLNLSGEEDSGNFIGMKK
ncbi:hypothetical protein HOH87_03205 [bacterium]|jgi:hypothetical protein|nr:hypothetical protein [bacterium]